MSVPRFLADEDLRFEIVLATRRLQPSLEIRTIVEVGCTAASDDSILEYAHANGWIVVSHDVNTMKAAADGRVRSGSGLNGLLLIPQSRSTRSVTESLILIWSASQAEEWHDRIVYLPL